jgi:hypothetical protein
MTGALVSIRSIWVALNVTKEKKRQPEETVRTRGSGLFGIHAMNPKTMHTVRSIEPIIRSVNQASESNVCNVRSLLYR